MPLSNQSMALTYFQWPETQSMHERPDCPDFVLSYPAISLGKMAHGLEKRTQKRLRQVLQLRR